MESLVYKLIALEVISVSTGTIAALYVLFMHRPKISIKSAVNCVAAGFGGIATVVGINLLSYLAEDKLDMGIQSVLLVIAAVSFLIVRQNLKRVKATLVN